jgi:hypothetical protein
MNTNLHNSMNMVIAAVVAMKAAEKKVVARAAAVVVKKKRVPMGHVAAKCRFFLGTKLDSS